MTIKQKQICVKFLKDQWKHYVMMCLECDDGQLSYYRDLKKKAMDLYRSERKRYGLS